MNQPFDTKCAQLDDLLGVGRSFDMVSRELYVGGRRAKMWVVNGYAEDMLLERAVEKLQDKGFVAWKTDKEAGRTYVELSSKAVELMAEEHDFMKRCYERLRTELGDDELRRTVDTMQKVTAILKEERSAD